jgi:hypothetical protein
MRTTFDKIAIGSTFYCNGNYCYKRTKRTATIYQYSRVFYFKANDVVNTVKDGL